MADFNRCFQHSDITVHIFAHSTSSYQHYLYQASVSQSTKEMWTMDSRCVYAYCNGHCLQSMTDSQCSK